MEQPTAHTRKAPAADAPPPAADAPPPAADAPLLLDQSRMAALVAFTAESFATASPVPFGAALVHTATGSLLVQARNAVMPENDPSAHAELRAVRLACSRLGQPSLAGYTLYSTCEPCPMCMANALWAGVERLVYGATIADASRHCRQIFIPAAEVIRRSDMECALTPEVSRELCVALFHHPAMLAAFATWSTRKA